MKYNRFEDLPVWKDAIALKLGIDDLCRHSAVRPLRNFVDQIDRASLSISNNIAEGFERGTTNELLAFLYIARGSAGEVRSMLCYCEQRPDMASLSDLKSQVSNLKSKSESISHQLRAWADSLQNSDIRGQRHLTDQGRAAYDQDRRARAFADKIRAEHEARVATWSGEAQSRSQDSVEIPTPANS